MRLLLTACLPALLSGCGSVSDGPSVPSAAEIARVETSLAKHPCIADLNLWERNYRFGMTSRRFWPQSNHPNLDVVEFHLRKAGQVSIQPGRVAVPTRSDGWPDSGPIQRLDGSFNLKSGRIGLSKCLAVVRPR